MDEWLTTQGLTFVNDGTYSHIRKGKKEVLDIMAISQSEMNNIKKWFVQDTQAILLKGQRCIRSISKMLCKIEYGSVFVEGQNENI